MKETEAVLRDLRNLSLDRKALEVMRRGIREIEEDEKRKALPAAQREALEEERRKLQDSLAAASGRLRRFERLIALLDPKEQKVLRATVVEPRPGAMIRLSEELHLEHSSLYRIRAQAIRKLARLRGDTGE